VAMSRDRKLDELASVEFEGSLEEAFGRYARALRELSRRWDTELGLASTDVRAALVAMRGRWLSMDRATRKTRARRVARRLRRAQTLAAGVTARAERFPREYARHFLVLTATEAKKAQQRIDREGN
jgi:hypothetical protein